MTEKSNINTAVGAGIGGVLGYVAGDNIASSVYAKSFNTAEKKKVSNIFIKYLKDPRLEGSRTIITKNSYKIFSKCIKGGLIGVGAYLGYKLTENLLGNLKEGTIQA